MKRKEFLQQMGLGAFAMGIGSVSNLINQKQIKVYDNYIRGTFAYDFKHLKDELKEGETLILKREAKNKYDSFAISVYFNKQQLGYIAAYENIVLANMMDAEVPLTAIISHSNPDSYRNNIAIKVFCELISPTPLLIKELEKRADDKNDIYRGNKFEQ